MGGKGDAPAPPDFGPIAAASEKSADLSFKLGQDQLAWAKQQFGLTSDITNKVVNSALQTQDLNNAAAAQDRARYTSLYQPLENNLVSDAQDYASGERRDQQQGRALAQTNNQFSQSRLAAANNLESFGVDPSSTRYAALDIGTRNAQAAAGTAAANQASQIVDTQGRALRSEAINVGRGYPSQIAQTYATGLNAGNQAENSTLANTASGANTMGTGIQWQGMGNQALGVWGNTLQMGFQDQMAQYNANQQSSSGWGSALGLLGGIASGFNFAEGGAVPAPPGAGLPVAPTSPAATTGGAVPTRASPSNGAVVDDIPARLNAGEFVMPRDVVQWYGEKGMQDLIQKARKAQATAPAQPSVGPPIPSRGAPLPSPGAIPAPGVQHLATGGPIMATLGVEGANPGNNIGTPVKSTPARAFNPYLSDYYNPNLFGTPGHWGYSGWFESPDLRTHGGGMGGGNPSSGGGMGAGSGGSM